MKTFKIGQEVWQQDGTSMLITSTEPLVCIWRDEMLVPHEEVFEPSELLQVFAPPVD